MSAYSETDIRASGLRRAEARAFGTTTATVFGGDREIFLVHSSVSVCKYCGEQVPKRRCDNCGAPSRSDHWNKNS